MARYGSATTSTHLDVEVILLAWYLFFVFFSFIVLFPHFCMHCERSPSVFLSK